jgi:hypothetical protein
MRASKGGSVMDFITSALVFRGGLNKLLRVWLVRAHCILKREISVDYIDERVSRLSLLESIPPAPSRLGPITPTLPYLDLSFVASNCGVMCSYWS